jgi:hypothetical protein
VAVAVAGCPGATTTPQGAVEARLALVAKQGVFLPVGADRVQFPSLELSEVTVDVDAAHARVLFRAEGQGRVAQIHVGYIGGEAVGLTHSSSGWEAENGIWLPRVAGVLDALQRRDQALAHGDGAALAALSLDGGTTATPTATKRPPVRAWLVRIEGEGATVSEVSEGLAAGPDTTKRLELHQTGNGWRFTSSLL